MCTRRATFLRGMLPAMLALLVLASPHAHAQQPSVTLNVSPRPNPYLADWASHKETAILTVTVPPGSRTLQAKFRVEITKDGALQARTKTERMTVVNIPAGVSVYYADQMIPFNAVDFFGSAKETAARTGMLPAGTYEFCVDLLDAQSGASLITSPVCRSFVLTGYDAPILLAPEDKSAISADARPTFRWSPVTPAPPGVVQYRVQVFEVLPGQRTTQAFRSNKPILEKSVTSLTQLIWPPEFLLPGRVSEYVWTVRALDDKGRPIGETDGYAQPFSFTIESGIAQRTPGEQSGAQRTGGGNENAQRQAGGAGAQRRVGGEEVVAPVQVGPRVVGAQIAILNPNQQAPDTTNYSGGNPQAPPTACQPSQTTPPPVQNQTPSSKPASEWVDSTVSVGLFAMKVLTASGTSASLTGTGSILVPWLRTPVAVEFTGIKVNSAAQVFQGDVVTQTDATPDPYQTQWAANILGSLPWTKTRIKNLDTWLKNTGGKLVKGFDLQTQVNNYTNTPVKLPLGINDLKGYTIAIAEMKFTSVGAKLAAVMSLPVLEHNDNLGFKVSELACTPSGPSFKAGTFALLEDVTFAPNTNTWSVTFKAPTDSVNGTFIDWDCDGFRRAQVDLDFALPRTWVVPSPDNNQNVKANVKTWITDWDDWIINANLPKCTVVGTNGMDLQVTNMAYDHSDLRNPTGIKFPKGFSGDTALTFQGFFIKQAKLILPEKLSTFEDPTQRVSVYINNLILNKTGITCAIEAANIIQFPKGNIASLAASIDSIKLTMINSGITTAYMRGSITLPVADTTKTNALTYKALFQNGNGFQFSLMPAGPITTPFLGGGTFTLAKTSNIAVAIKDKSSFSCTLNGSFGWTDATVGPIKHVDITTEFENMKLSWVEGGNFAFAIGTWSFASPQKKLAKIPVTIDNIKYTPKTAQPGEALRGTVGFELIVNLVEKIAGRSKLEVTGAIEHPGGMKFKPKFIEARVDSIGLYVKTAAVIIDGYVKFYQDDPMYGNGFNGGVKATFSSAEVAVSASARFGTTSYQSAEPYRYWYVDAKVILPPPGITFLPGYAFYGFGAAAWQRMNVQNMPAPNPAQVASATSPSGATASGATFTPSSGVGFGFKITAVLGTTPDSKKFNADVSLGGQFSPSGGLINIHINGELWAMAKITERANAPVHGTIDIDYNHPQRIFHMQAVVFINKDPISTPNGAGMVMHLEGKTGIWYVKIGEPSNRNLIKVANVNTESYFMFGKNITPPTGFSSAITSGLQSVGVYNLSPSGAATSAAIAGTGYASGVGLTFDTGDRDTKLFNRVYLRYRVGGGFEVNLSLVKYPDNAVCSSGAGLTGVNKWYAQGSVAAYAIFYVKIHVEPKGAPCLWCCKGNHPDGCDFTLASIKLGAWLTGGFPKPTWVQGQAGGSFNLLDGAVKGSFNVNIDYGSQCYPSGSPESGPVAQAEDAAAAQTTKLVQSLYPAVNTSGFPVTDRARVLYGFTPNETFDVIESQGGTAGTTINRTFQARYTLMLRKKSGATYSAPIQIQTTANALGEYIVQLKPSGPVIANNLAHPIMSNDGPSPNAPPPSYGPNLDSSTTYSLSVTGTLYERQANVWVPAKTRTNQPVTETAEVLFTTPVAPPKPVLMTPKQNMKGN